MYKTHKNVISPEDDTPIWRYMTFTSFYQVLLTRSLFFARLDKYTDSLEGSLPDITRDALYKHRLGFPYTSKQEAMEWVETELKNIANYKAYTLSNSWTMNRNESYAMWKIYLSGQREGVAIKTTVKKLKDCLHKQTNYEIYSGKVIYQPFSEKEIDVFTVSTNKRKAYEYEQEYRALIFHQFDVDRNAASNRNPHPKFEIGTNVTIDPMELIDDIYVSPFCFKSFDAILRSALDNLLPSFDQSKIIRSGIQDS